MKTKKRTVKEKRAENVKRVLRYRATAAGRKAYNAYQKWYRKTHRK